MLTKLLKGFGKSPARPLVQSPLGFNKTQSEFATERCDGSPGLVRPIVLADAPVEVKPHPVAPFQATNIASPPELCAPAKIVPVNKGEMLWIDKFLSKKQQHAQDRPQQAPFEKLAALPASVQHQVQALINTANAPPSSLISAIWSALESNIRTHTQLWNFIEVEDGNQVSGAGYIDLSNDISTSHSSAETVLGRYRDIALVKATAVQDMVRLPSMQRSHEAPVYLHANYVDLGCGRIFIAGQKPLQGEIPGFQHMLINQDVGLIVDLTRLKEAEQNGEYVSLRQNKTPFSDIHDWHVSCSAFTRLTNLPATAQEFQIDNGLASSKVERLHFQEWPDHGVISVSHLIALANQVEEMADLSNRKIFVHCMAGMGRTGTLVSFLSARKQIRSDIEAMQIDLSTAIVLHSVVDVMAKGRIQRGPLFVQTESQFNLIVKALLNDPLLRKSTH